MVDKNLGRGATRVYSTFQLHRMSARGMMLCQKLACDMTSSHLIPVLSSSPIGKDAGRKSSKRLVIDSRASPGGMAAGSHGYAHITPYRSPSKA
jgi:hypothetical protein